MAYIGFIDMVGTRSAALISSKEYSEAICDFHEIMKETSTTIDKCSIFGYSDNAYIEIPDLNEMILFFKRLRRRLIRNHRYFNAAIGIGELGEVTTTNSGYSNGCSMRFNSPSTINVYLAQSRFTGIGISLSPEIVKELDANNLHKAYCNSIYKTKATDSKQSEFVDVVDIRYDPTSVEEIEFVLSDYVLTSLTNKGAGRYYLTPILSMIRSLEEPILERKTEEIVELLTLNKIKKTFMISELSEFTTFFLLCLIGHVVSIEKEHTSLAAHNIFEKIMKSNSVNIQEILKSLESAPVGVITSFEKRQAIKQLYSICK